MGYLPQLSELAASQQMMSQFGGYNHNPRINEAEFDGMSNMSSLYYPVISPRNKRGTLTLLTDPNGIAAKSNMFWVDGTSLYHNGALVTGLTLADSEKKFVSMGAFLLIWPDKKYYNTADQTYGSLEASITIAGDITCTMTKVDGTAYGAPTVSATEPNDPDDTDLWLDTSETVHVLKQYSESTSAWVPVATTFIKIAADNIGALFSEYDGVTISGFTNTALNGDFILYGADDDYIIITGILDATVEQTGGVTVTRSVPAMDFLVESENRVWGCSSANHEIYACKQGDPKNWHVFMGLSTDSYAATIGSDGDFTGAAVYFGQVLFWKEDILHKITGNKPASYNIASVPCRGVEKGSEKSLCNVNERLYYKSRSCICAYDGALPVTVSNELGDVRYRSGVAGALGNKYYISMKDSADAYHMFVYDTALGLWHREDSTQAMQFAAHQGELFYINAANKKIISVNGRLSVHEGGVKYDAVNGAAEANFAWCVETGDIGMALPDNKYIGRLMIRLEAASAMSVTVSFKYDSGSTWEDHSVTVATPKRTVQFPFVPRRCDHLRIKIAGTGACKIYSITKTVEEGGSR